MSTFQFTLDDAAPYIQYQGNWQTNHTGDPFASDYFRQTFHGTVNSGDTATISFNGTGITVYGAQRPNHGNYAVALDGGAAVQMSGFAAVDSIQKQIYTASNLDGTKQHSVTFTNQGNTTAPWFDIDYAVITVNASKPLKDTRRVDNTWATWSYTNFNPSDASHQPIDPDAYFNKTAQISGTVGATATYVWNGSSIAIFGGLYHDHGEFTVSLDGVNSGPYNGTYIGESLTDIQTEQALFFASNLNDGPHSITLTNTGGSIGPFIDIDYAESNSSIYANTSVLDGNYVPPAASHKSNAGAIAGGVVGGVVGALLIGALIFFFVRRSRRDRPKDWGRGRGNEVDMASEEPKYNEPLATPYYPNGNGPASNAWGGSSQGFTSYQTNLDRSVGGSPQTTTGNHPILATVPPPPASSATSYPASHAGGERIPLVGIAGSQSGSSSGPSSSSGQPSTSSPTPLNAPWGGQTGPQKSMGVGLPYTAQPVGNQHQNTPPPINREDSSSQQQRMLREGREGDAGPYQHPEEEHNTTLLPPDYEQATEPLPGQRPQ